VARDIVHARRPPRLPVVLGREEISALLAGLSGPPRLTRTTGPRAALEDVTVVEQAVEDGGDGGGVAEDLAPVLHRARFGGGGDAV